MLVLYFIKNADLTLETKLGQVQRINLIVMTSVPHLPQTSLMKKQTAVQKEGEHFREAIFQHLDCTHIGMFFKRHPTPSIPAILPNWIVSHRSV